VNFKRVILLHPNFEWSGRRSWKLLPYGLGLLNGALRQNGFDSWIYDAGFDGHTEHQFRTHLRETAPDVIGVTTFSTEYISETRHTCRLIREELPEVCLILGGVLPTVFIEKAVEDRNVDYFVMGEGEYRLVRLLKILNGTASDLQSLDGIAYGWPRTIQPPTSFIENLDGIGFPDYGGLEPRKYMNNLNKLCHWIIPRQFPFATTLTSRGCPFRCIFCSAAVVSGRKVRLRSASNVLEEVQSLVRLYGIKEMIFLDDHFFSKRQRAVEIMKGLKQIDRGLTWKCENLALWTLDEHMLALMRETGCYQMTVSIESGNQHVVSNIIRKPIRLDKVPRMIDLAKRMGFEIAANFVIGFPGETWDQIRDTFRYAEHLSVDMANFHIATPLPQTELMDICVKGGYCTTTDDALMGYTRASIHTDQFSPTELEILRAFEWDRINFSSSDRKKTIARMEGITEDELDTWRVHTRQNLGVTVGFDKNLTRGEAKKIC
jgi:radical SAM superfamily enzyme YgiQ (UPF0313 family)